MLVAFFDVAPFFILPANKRRKANANGADAVPRVLPRVFFFHKGEIAVCTFVRAETNVWHARTGRGTRKM